MQAASGAAFDASMAAIAASEAAVQAENDLATAEAISAAAFAELEIAIAQRVSANAVYSAVVEAVNANTELTNAEDVATANQAAYDQAVTNYGKTLDQAIAAYDEASTAAINAAGELDSASRAAFEASEIKTASDAALEAASGAAAQAATDLANANEALETASQAAAQAASDLEEAVATYDAIVAEYNEYITNSGDASDTTAQAISGRAIAASDAAVAAAGVKTSSDAAVEAASQAAFDAAQVKASSDAAVETASQAAATAAANLDAAEGLKAEKQAAYDAADANFSAAVATRSALQSASDAAIAAAATVAALTAELTEVISAANATIAACTDGSITLERSNLGAAQTTAGAWQTVAETTESDRQADYDNASAAAIAARAVYVASMAAFNDAMTDYNNKQADFERKWDLYQIAIDADERAKAWVVTATAARDEKVRALAEQVASNAALMPVLADEIVAAYDAAEVTCVAFSTTAEAADIYSIAWDAHNALIAAAQNAVGAGITGDSAEASVATDAGLSYLTVARTGATTSMDNANTSKAAAEAEWTRLNTEAMRLQAAAANGGIATSHDAIIRMIASGSSIGANDNALAINSNGTVTITGPDTGRIDSVYLETGLGITSKAIKVANDLVINSGGNIMPVNSKSVFTATNITMSAVNGGIGVSGGSVMTDADYIDLYSKDGIYLYNDGDVTMTALTLNGGDSRIAASGDINLTNRVHDEGFTQEQHTTDRGIDNVPIATYVVHYVVVNGTDLPDGTALDEYTIDRPADPTTGKPVDGDDFIFDGWYTDPECEHAWDFSTLATEESIPNGVEITLYGEWVPPAYCVVTFDTVGIWQTPPAQTVIINRKATAPALTPVEGKAFLGWYTDVNYTTAWDFNAPVATDMALYAKWANMYTVEFDTNGHGVVPAQSVTCGSTATNVVPTTAGYTFTGWYEDAECTSRVAVDMYTITADTTFYAAWDINVYTVTFNTSGMGITPSSMAVTYGALIPVVQPSASGYSFAGWYTDEDFNTPWNIGTDVVTGDITLYAKWTTASGGFGGGGGGGAAVGGASDVIAAEGVLIAIGEGMNLGDVAIEALDAAIAAGTAIAGEKLEQAILDCLAGEEIASAYMITAAEEVDGKLVVTLPAKGASEGDVVTVIFTEDGTTKAVNAPVSGSSVSVETTELGLFVVMEEERNVIFFELDSAVKKDGAYIPMAVNRYNDVTPDKWYFEGIGFMDAYGVINGMGGDNFEPNGNVTLAQLATMIMRFTGEETMWSSGIGETGRNAGTQAGENAVAAINAAYAASLAGRFESVVNTYNAAGVDEHWYDAAMNWAEANMMIGGSNSAGADDSMIRAQVILMIYNMAGALGWVDGSTDGYDLSGYIDGSGMHADELRAMQWAVATGLVAGRTPNYLAAGETVTRAEVSTILTRLMKTFDEKVLFLPRGSMNDSAE